MNIFKKKIYKKLFLRLLYFLFVYNVYWREVLRFAWILISLFLALHAKTCAFIAVGNEISQFFNILRCNCIQDGAMSLNPEWNSNVKRYVTLNTICIGSPRFLHGGWENGRVQNSQHDLFYSVDPGGTVCIKNA